MAGKAKTRGEQKRAKKAKAAFAAAAAMATPATATSAAILPLPAPREGSMKPTREARAHAEYEQVKADAKGAKHYRRKITCLLDRLEINKTITRQQSEAGKRYDVDHKLVWGVFTRDSTQLPIGGVSHETPAQAEKIARAKERMNRILNMVGPSTYLVLRRVASFDEPIGRQDTKERIALGDKLRAALDAAAEVYGVPTYAA